MALPLIWLGAGLAAAYAGTKLAREKQVADGHIQHFPGDCDIAVEPLDGAIVCCGIYEVFQHTGIWVDGQIVELRGNGLIRGISPTRFLHDRSGNRIYVACDEHLVPLVDPQAVVRGVERVFEYSEYDLIKNNCHRFVHQCVTGSSRVITRFAELNEALSQHFNTVIHWQPAAIPLSR